MSVSLPDRTGIILGVRVSEKLANCYFKKSLILKGHLFFLSTMNCLTRPRTDLTLPRLTYSNMFEFNDVRLNFSLS